MSALSLGNEICRSLPPLPTSLKKWVKDAFRPGIRVAALSIPRGNAKTFLAGRVAAMFLDPSFFLKEEVRALGFKRENETIIVSGSLDQCRTLFSFIREALREQNLEQDFIFSDSSQRLQIKHKRLPIKLRAISSSGKRSMGLSTFNLILLDEPASMKENDGRLLYDGVRQSLGKRPGQRLLILGTLAPSEPASWWPSLVSAGSDKALGVHVTSIQAEPEEDWKEWATVKRCNPFMQINRNLQKVIRAEWKEALKNPAMEKSFQAYRLNRHVEVKHEMLVRLEDWEHVEVRDVPERDGKPIVAIDLGAHRSWSAAWILYKNGRSECYALAGGIPDLTAREKADSVPAGLYQRLHDEGVLLIDAGYRMARPLVLVNHLRALEIEPVAVYADRFLIEGLQDVVPKHWNVIERKTRWSEATEDITGFRRLVGDGPLSIVPECRTLAKFALSQAVVLEDEGNLRISKRRKWKSRDDVAVCATLAGGALVRHLAKPQPEPLRHVVVNV